jgi:hypothetical protein
MLSLIEQVLAVETCMADGDCRTKLPSMYRARQGRLRKIYGQVGHGAC